MTVTWFRLHRAGVRHRVIVELRDCLSVRFGLSSSWLGNSRNIHDDKELPKYCKNHLGVRLIWV